MPVNNPPIPSVPDDLVRKPVSIASNGLYWGAFAWFQQNAIIRAGNKTFIFFLGDDYDEWGVVLDHETNTWGAPVHITDGHGSDLHYYASASIDSNGYFYLFYGCHVSSLYYRKSTNPYDISAWGAETSLATYASYPKTIVDSNNNIYIFYRDGDGTNGGRYIKFRKSTDSGSTWGGAITVVDAGVTNKWAYQSMVGIGADDSLHFTWTLRTTGGANDSTEFSGVYYMKSLDGGSTWKKSDGTGYTLAVTPATAEAITTAISVSTPQVAVDGNGNPHVIYVVADVGSYFVNNKIHYCYLSGGVWQDVTLEGDNFDLSTHIVIDGLTFYIFSTQLISGTREVIMFRSVDSGAYWVYYQLTSNSSLDGVNLSAINTSIGGLELVWALGNDSALIGVSEFSADAYYTDFSWIEMLCGDIENNVPIVGDSTGTSSAIINTYARGLREAGTPTILPMGGVLANQYLKDVGGYISGSVPTFLELSDTPSSYSGQGGKYTAVKSDASGIEFVVAPSGGGGSSGLVIYDDGVYKVTGTAISFDSNLSVVTTGSVAFVSSPGGTIANTNGTLVQDEGVFLGTGTTFNFVGAGVVSSISGSVVQVLVTGSGNSAGTILAYASLITGSYTLTASFANVDTTSLSVTFVVPPSGKVLVEMEVFVTLVTATFQPGLSLMSGTTSLSPTEQSLFRTNAGIFGSKVPYSYVATGLIPGATITWNMGGKAIAGAGNINHANTSIIKVVAL